MSTLDGDVRVRISNEMVGLHSEYYGRGPTKAKVYADGDIIAVVLEETFTPAEKTLIARGESEGIQDIRRRFQRAMADQFRSIVEQATGREVRSFLSETDVDNDISARSSCWARPARTWRVSRKPARNRKRGTRSPPRTPGR